MEEPVFQLQDELFVLTDVLIKADWLAVTSCVIQVYKLYYCLILNKTQIGLILGTLRCL